MSRFFELFLPLIGGVLVAWGFAMLAPPVMRRLMFARRLFLFGGCCLYAVAVWIAANSGAGLIAVAALSIATGGILGLIIYAMWCAINSEIEEAQRRDAK